MKKSITIPESISVQVRGETRSITFAAMMAKWLNDSAWGTSLELGELRRDIRQAWEKFQEEHGGNGIGGAFNLSVRAHGALAQVARKPSPNAPYEPEVIDRAIDLIYAVTEAKSIAD